MLWGHGRPGLGWVLGGLLLACAARLAWAQPAESGLDLMRQDAQLADVCFVNRHLGWAVGDRGVIWNTRDGGRTWSQQTSRVQCRLNSVFFLDENTGWAAGGWTQSLTHVSHGVLLHTRDGGRNWTPQHRLLLPTLYSIKFFDARRGVALGKPSALFPSGVFQSDDGGRTWTPIPGKHPGAWRTGDFINPDTGALAGSVGMMATLRRRTIEPVSSGVDLQSFREMQLIAPASGWLVGDGGLVMKTADLGQSWQTATAILPGRAAELFDLNAVAVQGNHVWVAGAPGTKVFQSTDQGRTWQAFSTGSHVPIESLTFVDPQHGWAVGALGTILATGDGGRTWRRQQSGGDRAALVGFFSDPQDVPLELFSQLSGGDGYLGVVHIVGRRDIDTQAGVKPDLPDRTHEALVQVGASGAWSSWQFPLRQSGLGLSADQILATLDRVHDGRALETLQQSLVRQIRTWRPEVIVTHDASARSEDALRHLVNQVVLQAVEEAADPTRSIPLATTAGLDPWQVKKVYGTLPEGQSGSINLETAKLVPALGRSLADQASVSRGLIFQSGALAPARLGFRLLLDRIPQDRGKKRFFSGVALSPGGAARREFSQPNTEGIAHLKKLAQKQRNMQELIRRGEAAPGASDAWLAQVGSLTQGLDTSNACRLLHQLAQQYFQTGRWDLAAGAYETLVERDPNHPLAQAARVWLLQYYASSEVAWRMRHNNGYVVRQATATTGSDSHLNISSQGRLEKATALGREIESVQPELFADPRLRFSLAAAHRKLGLGAQASRYFLTLRQSRNHDSWWLAAAGEKWLEKRVEQPPKPLWTAPSTSRKPHLDGKLDEAFWIQARTIELRSSLKDDRQWPAVARLAYDRQFLYLAVSCQKAPGVKYTATSQLRTRDADLSAHDRVDLLLDVDRDYATYYRLTIDHRGWTSESCWGDRTWDPTWYVASEATSDRWVIEAAIPLATLSATRPEAKHVWNVGLQRTVPGAGFQSWSNPAGTKIMPEGFSYLLFQ